MSVIDLANLPRPIVIEEIGFEPIVVDMQADLVQLFPQVAAILQLETSLLNKLIQVFAYREVLLRARMNDAARSLFLAYAQATDLDGLGANVGVKRLVLVPAQGGQPALMEDDLRFLRRIQLEAENRSGGRLTGYVGGILTNFPDIIDAGAWVDRSNMMEPTVRIALMSATGDGTATPDQIEAVQEYVLRKDVRQATDIVSIRSVDVVPVSIDVVLHHKRGPDPAVARASAETALAAMVLGRRSPGRDLPLSAIAAASSVIGVERVSIASPAQDIFLEDWQLAKVTGITVNSALVGG